MFKFSNDVGEHVNDYRQAYDLQKWENSITILPQKGMNQREKYGKKIGKK